MIEQDAIPVADALKAALDVAVAKAPEKLVVAVSGGRDSMTLMHALARWFPSSVAAVATFDHGSGMAATDAAALVAAEARRLGLTVIRERARSVTPTEDAWRTARWSFLKRVARGYHGVVATAHTRDDQVETIVLRLLRGTGARGLAALAASSTIVRPWLPLSRQEVAEWATRESIPFVDDPTNFTRQYFRSRVRLDLLPALEAVQPGFAESMLSIGRDAAEWRRGVDALVDGMELQESGAGSVPGALRVRAGALASTNESGLGVLWPALMARIGVALNQRGTAALVRFTKRSRNGNRLELAGGPSVVHVRDGDTEFFELRPPPGRVRLAPAIAAKPGNGGLPLRYMGWRFKPCEVPALVTQTAGAAVVDAWVCGIPAGARCEMRVWRDGDRIRTAGAPAGRRVARYFSEAHIPAVDRREWPVVVVDNEILWIPGVCRSLAAPHRPGRPDVTWYRCEREHG